MQYESLPLLLLCLLLLPLYSTVLNQSLHNIGSGLAEFMSSYPAVEGVA